MRAELDGTSGRRFHGLRWVICGLLFLSVAVNYVDRQAISILKLPLTKELGWSDTDYSHVVAAFQFAYGAGYLLGGRFMDLIGVRLGFPLIVLLWSLASAAHGLCSFIPVDSKFAANLLGYQVVLPGTVAGFMTARIFLGLTEGGNFPAAIKLVAEWFPVKERALATGLFNTGTNVGAVLCMAILPVLYTWLGWPTIFYLTGLLGVMWVVLWLIIYDVPERHRWLTEAEREHILSGRQKTDQSDEKIPWLTLFLYRPVWVSLITGSLAGSVWTIYMFFLPDFLDRRYGVKFLSAGVLSALFYLVASFGGVWGGWLAGRLMGRGVSVNRARKLALLACALAALVLAFAPHAPSAFIAIVMLGIAGTAHQGWSANMYSFVSDTMPKNAVGAAVGLGGCLAYWTGGAVAELIGYVLKTTNSYALVFAGASMMYLISLGVLQVLVPRIEPTSPIKTWADFRRHWLGR